MDPESRSHLNGDPGEDSDYAEKFSQGAEIPLWATSLSDQRMRLTKFFSIRHFRGVQAQ